jgi:hypothetical protein
MPSRTLLAALLLALALPAVAADYPGTLKVTFRTTDCDGATGMASVNADAVTRVQPYTCPNGRQLKQLLARSPAGTNEAYTLTADESAMVETEIRRVMDARRKALEQGKPIVIQH